MNSRGDKQASTGRASSLKWLILLAAWIALPAQAQMQVRVEPVIRAALVEQLPLAGTVTSPRYSDLTTQESGMVLELNVEPGDRVERGDVLLKLDGQITELELRRLLAREEEARVALQDAARLADEGRRLIEDRNISRTQYESRLANEAAEQQRLEQLQTQVQMQRVKVERHTLKAPFAGVIGMKHTEVGEWQGAGSPAVQLVQMNPLRAQANIPERFYGEIREGTPVTIHIQALPGQPVSSAVQGLVSVTNFETRSFTAWMDIANNQGELAPGMSAELVFHLGSDVNAVLQVPADAVVRAPGGQAVVWVVRDGRAERVSVELGRRSGSMVEVTPIGTGATLAAGELVVTLGNETLAPGEPVTTIGS